MSIGHTHPGFRTVHTNTKKTKTQKHNHTESIDKPHTPWVLSGVINTNTQETHTHTNTKIPTQIMHTGANTHTKTQTPTDTQCTRSCERHQGKPSDTPLLSLQAWDSDPTI